MTFMHCKTKRFLSDDSGAVTLEAVLILPFFLAVLTVIFELSFFYWKSNQLNIGMAQIVRAMALGEVAAPTFDAKLSSKGAVGIEASCGAGVAPCTANAMMRMLTGSDANCDAVATTRYGMCDYVQDVTADHLRLTYTVIEYADGDLPVARTRVQLELVAYTINLPIISSVTRMAPIALVIPPAQSIMEYRGI